MCVSSAFVCVCAFILVDVLSLPPYQLRSHAKSDAKSDANAFVSYAHSQTDANAFVPYADSESDANAFVSYADSQTDANAFVPYADSVFNRKQTLSSCGTRRNFISNLLKRERYPNFDEAFRI